jgi:hypothetical protein
MFQEINRGHRRNLHAFLAGAVETQKAFLCDSDSYGMLRFDQFWEKPIPENLSNSSDVLIFLMRAKTSGGQNRARKYARVVDYLIAKGINDCERHLNEHGYENVLNKAIEEFPSTRNTRKKGTTRRISMSVPNSVVGRIERVKENCSVPVTFLIRCTMQPGGKGGLSGRIMLGIEPEESATLTSDQFREHLRKRGRSFKVETKLAGGVTPYVLSPDGLCVLGMRGDPLADPPNLQRPRRK